MIIRHATDTDLAGILAIYNDAILKTTAVFDYRPHTLEMRRQWIREKQAAGLPVLVAADDDEVVGFSSYGPFRAWPAYKYSVEHSVYVGAAMRRRGVGAALVQAIVAEATRAEMHRIVTGITGDNDASIRLHMRFGFKEVGRLSEVGYKFGRWLDLVFLELPLPGPTQPRSDEAGA